MIVVFIYPDGLNTSSLLKNWHTHPHMGEYIKILGRIFIVTKVIYDYDEEQILITLHNA